MKTLIVFGAALVATLTVGFSAMADEYVHGYTRSNGTYVQPYYRSSPDGTVGNNYSYQGNINPYTGNVGHNSYGYSQSYGSQW